MELVRRDVPEATLRAVGTPSTTLLPAWACVRPGARSEIARMLGEVRVCVVPRPINAYTDLALPVKVMDYLSLGKPIVATSAAETASFLEATGAALLVRDDPRDIARGILRLLTEPGLAEQMGLHAKAFASQPDVSWIGRARAMLDALLPASRP
jgi:glycosyltransferase involved in cell wall biosynthesis